MEGSIFDKIKMPNVNSSKNIKKVIEEKNQEKSELYKYIGMEICNLWKAGKIYVQDLEVYITKAEALKQEILDIEAEVQRAEMLKKGTRVCTCGCQLTQQDRFCPQCGKPMETGSVYCSCGQQLESGMQFCPNCGNSVKSMGENPQGVENPAGSMNGEPLGTEEADSGNTKGNAQMKYKECICGAKVPEGQFMCMECGRKIEGN